MIWNTRCLAWKEFLDDTLASYCSQGHTDLLKEEFGIGALWDGWGIVGDISVSV